MQSTGNNQTSFVKYSIRIQDCHLRLWYDSCLLGLVDGLGHGEERAVGEDGEHHKVVEVLVHR